jgi:hypothetical protein
MSTYTLESPFCSVSSGKQAVDSGANASSREVDQVQSTMYSEPKGSQDTSYLAHTQASKAKQTGKVELGPLQKHSQEPPQESVSGPRVDSVLCNRPKAPGSQLQEDKNNLFLSPSISTPGKHRINPDDTSHDPYVKQKNPVTKLLEDASSRGTSSLSLASGSNNCKESPKESLAPLRPDTDSFQTGDEALEEDISGDKITSVDTQRPQSKAHRESNALVEAAPEDRADIPKRKRVHDEQIAEMQVIPEDVSVGPRVSQYKVRDTEVDITTEEQVRSNLVVPTTVAKQGELHVLSDSFETSGDVRTLLDRNLELNREIAEPKQDLQTKRKDETNMMEFLPTSNAVLGRLRNDVTVFTHILNQISETKFHRTCITTKTLEDVTRTDFDPDAVMLHTALVRFSGQMESKIRRLDSRTAQLQSSLADKERQLSWAITALEAERENRKFEALNTNPAHEVEGNYWEQRCKEEQRLKEHAGRAVTSIKKVALEQYKPDLEKHNRELRIELSELLDKNNQLDEQVKRYTDRALLWEGEYKTAKQQAEKKYAGLEQEIQRQEAELRDYIKEYHDKTLDPCHWNLEGLQDKIKSLERDRDITDKLLNATKSENARLEDEIERLMDVVTAYEQETKKSSDTWTLDNVVPILPPHSSFPNNHASLSGQHLITKVHPSYHPMKVSEREAKLRELHAEQVQRRRQDAMLEAFMEKVRARMLGPDMYERKEWKQYLGQTSWEMWDGEGWVADGELYGDGASEKERGIVKMLREKGVLPL